MVAVDVPCRRLFKRQRAAHRRPGERLPSSMREWSCDEGDREHGGGGLKVGGAGNWFTHGYRWGQAIHSGQSTGEWGPRRKVPKTFAKTYHSIDNATTGYLSTANSTVNKPNFMRKTLRTFCVTAIVMAFKIAGSRAARQLHFIYLRASYQLVERTASVHAASGTATWHS